MSRILLMIPLVAALGGCVVVERGGYDAGLERGRQRGSWQDSAPRPAPTPRQDSGWHYIPGRYGPQVGEGYTSGGYAQQSPNPYGHWRRGPDPLAARSTENAGN